MGTAAVMAKELDAVAQRVRETVSRLEGKVPLDKKDEFDSEKNGALSAIAENKDIIATLKDDEISPSRISETPFLSDYINKLGSPLYARVNQEEKQLLLSLRNETERFDRRRQLLRPSSKEDFLQGVWWMSQRGRNQDLDLLVNVRGASPFVTLEILHIVSGAEQEIMKRDNKELLDFFDFDAAQFVQVIQATVARSKTPASPDLRKAFNVEYPTQVINSLERIKQVLQGSFEPSRISQWLSRPLGRFDGKSPRDMLLEGFSLPILSLLTDSMVNVRSRDFRRKIAASMLALTCLLVFVGLFPLGQTVLGFGMVFGGSLLAYECYLLLKACRIPLALRGLK